MILIFQKYLFLHVLMIKNLNLLLNSLNHIHNTYMDNSLASGKAKKRGDNFSMANEKVESLLAMIHYI